MHRTPAAKAVVLFAVFALGVTAAFAQVKPDAGQILRELKEPPREPPRPLEVLPRGDVPRPALGAPELKLTPRGFRISGNTVFTEAELLGAVRDFVGKELDINGLNDAATAVRSYYRARGYFLAQAYLPRQEIRDGIVEIAVIEGRIGKLEVNVKEGTRISEHLIRDILATHLAVGQLITETGLEKPLLLVNDLPNAIVTSEIRPSQTVGAADIRVNVEQVPDLVNGFVDFDNGGSRFTGEFRLGVTLNVNSPMNRGDQFTVRAFTTEERFLLQRIAYTLPVGPWGTRIGLSYLDFDYRLGKDFSTPPEQGGQGDLKAHGYGASTSVFAFHPFIRTRNVNLIGQFAIEDKRLFDRVDAFNDLTDTYIYNVKLGVVGDFRDRFLGGGLNSFNFTITEGSVDIRPEAKRTADQSPVGRKTLGPYAKYNYEFRRLQRISDNASLLLSLVGQAASKNLASAERFSLGGPSGVRAYPVGEAVGDNGWIFSAEYRDLVPGLKIRGGDLTLSGFYDLGHVRIEKDFVTGDAQVNNRNQRNLAGAGLGLSLGKDGDFLFRAAAAWRTENEAPTADRVKRIPRVWFQAVKWF